MNLAEGIHLFLSIASLLLLTRLIWVFTHKLSVPLVLGEILLGILIGPTFLGTLDPSLSQWLYPTQGTVGVLFHGLTKLALFALLFAAGLEACVNAIRKETRAVIYTSLTSFILPFFAGFMLVWLWPALFDVTPEKLLPFSCFMGIALAISALPVIIRILMDSGMYESRVGVITVASASIMDILGWLAFGPVLNAFNPTQVGGLPTWLTPVLWVVVVAALLFIGKVPLTWLAVRFKALPAFVSLPFGIGLCVLSTWLGQKMGLHTTLSAFLSGMLVGHSPRLSGKIREQISKGVMVFLSPLFFISIGASVNFASHLDFTLIAIIILVATASKVTGTYIGGQFSGLSSKEALAVGFALNARGAMEIILSKQALEAGLIQPSLFVALVIMALFTSMLSGPAVKALILKGNKEPFVQPV